MSIDAKIKKTLEARYAAERAEDAKQLAAYQEQCRASWDGQDHNENVIVVDTNQ